VPGIKFISDTSCDIPPDLLEKYEIDMVPFLISLDGETYYKEYVELSVKEFYRRLRTQDAYPKTSLPPVQDFFDVFKKYHDLGHEIICFNLTSKFSASYQSAVNAKNIMLENYPGASISVVDSEQASIGQGMLILESCRMRENGLTSAQIIENVEKLKQNSCIYLTVDSLTYLQKGGRIGKANALLGSLLSVKPIIAVRDGELIPCGKIRGRAKAEAEVLRLFDRDVKENKDKYRCYVISSDLPDKAAEFSEEAVKTGGYEIERCYDIGITIGAHIGPTVLGIGYIMKYEYL